MSIQPPRYYRAVVLDIEGTTTPVSFVYDALFPYASAHLERFIKEHWHAESVQHDVEELAAQAERDYHDGVPGVVPIAMTDAHDVIRQWVIDNVRWQMANDRKTTALKSLQGHIWKDGYERGELVGQVYPDVVRALKEWQDAHVPVYIYSSGSVMAQKLLFGHTEHGDLTPLLKGYFDTTTGPKKQAASYKKICAAIGVDGRHVLFATDQIDEAHAAREAGLKVVVMNRPGNAETGPHDYPVLETFEPLLPPQLP